MRVTFGKIGFVGSLLIILGLMFFPQQAFVSDAQALDKASMRLHWKASGMHVPFIVAMDQGFFKDEGIDCIVKEGAGSTATVKLMGANKDTFGMAGTNVIVKGVARGMPIIQVAVVEASKRQGVLSKPEAGIQSPKDLIGKTIAGSGAGTSDIFNAFLSANNIPIDKVKYLAAGRARLEAVAAGRADGSLGLGLDDIDHPFGHGEKQSRPHPEIYPCLH
jgi:NitT/TauT family transport system substrate-binding protein